MRTKFSFRAVRDAILPMQFAAHADSQAQHYCWQISCCRGFNSPHRSCMTQHIAAQLSPTQLSSTPSVDGTAQHSTAQHSTAQLTGVDAPFNTSELCSMLSASIEMHSNLVDLPLVCCDKMYSLLTGHIKDIKMMSESLPTMT